MIWDETDRRYEDENGRPIPAAKIRKLINEQIEKDKEEIRSKWAQVLAETITLDAFFLFMEDKVESSHVIAGLVAYGGVSQMTPQRWARISARVDSEMTYLSQFEQEAQDSFAAAETIASEVADAVQGESVRENVRRALLDAAPSEAEGIASNAVVESLAGTVETSEARGIAARVIEGLGLAAVVDSLIGGTIEPRASMYSDAAFPTYENSVVSREIDDGVTLGRRVLEPGDNCEDCIAAATEEFVPLDELPEIGDSVCLSRCRCEFEFQIDGGGFRVSDLFQVTITGQEESLVELN